MLIYLADLVHNHFPSMNTVPLNIGYVAAYAKSRFGKEIIVRLFKYADDLLNAIEKEPPSLIGLSNYSWNYRLNAFVGERIKHKFPHLPVVMGGPNIRLDNEGIASFLRANDHVDVYCMYGGEIPFSLIVEHLLNEPDPNKRTGDFLKQMRIGSCYSLISGELVGKPDDDSVCDEDRNLDYLPSPYASGLLDPFLTGELLPLFETNRGCPYSCSYCNWGVSVRKMKQVRQFSLDRVRTEMEYVANLGVEFPFWIIGDANFGILKRDVEIASYLRHLYDTQKPFITLHISWDKSARDHMVEIASILGHLSNAYIAFQTFTPTVAKMINRKNISIERLKKISRSLTASSERFRTDVLSGLPGETLQSNLDSLNTAFDLGFDIIEGGEVRLLPGSDLETEESRERFGLKTKYRLISEGFGVYDGQFVFELEESLRSTNWITEEEMIHLRVIRAMLYGSLTIGEHLPLLKYLRHIGVRGIVDVFQGMMKTRYDTPLAAECIDWLTHQAHSEWFCTPEEAERYFSDPTNRSNVLQNPTIKLNYDFLSRLLLSLEEYRAFSEHMYRVICHHCPSCDRKILRELVFLCEKRNYMLQALNGSYDNHNFIDLSHRTLKMLEQIRYITGVKDATTRIEIAINESRAKFIEDSINSNGPDINSQSVSMIIQKLRHSIYMEPVTERSP